MTQNSHTFYFKFTCLVTLGQCPLPYARYVINERPLIIEDFTVQVNYYYKI